MPVHHRERAFEAAIEHHLLTCARYARGDPDAFDRDHAMFPTEFIAFVKTTRPEIWQSLSRAQGHAFHFGPRRQLSPPGGAGRESVLPTAIPSARAA
jgi:hypothetical protein